MTADRILWMTGRERQPGGNYVPKVLALMARLKKQNMVGLVSVHINHEDGCAWYKDADCDCDPEVVAEPEEMAGGD